MHASWNKDKEKIKILLNDEGQPVMAETGPVATQMGVMARDGSLLPLHYNDWRYVPPHYKSRVWEEIKAHTTADDSMERWFMQSLGKKWQGWKCEAKKQGYKPFDSDADRLVHRPSRVTEQQWRCLVYYWSTDKKIQEKDSGKNPTRLDTFVKTHTRKDGKELNAETSAILDKLKELQQPCQDGSNTTPISEDEIFIQAIGPERPGRKRGCGLGVTSTQQLVAKKQHQESSEPPVNHREFRKMKSKMGKMLKAFETMGYIFEDSDDDLDESFPKENAPDASSVHRQMTTDGHRDNSEERHPESQSQEAGLLSQLNARPNSQGEGSPTNHNSQVKSGPSEAGNNQQIAKEADVQGLAELTRARNEKETGPSSQAKTGRSETGNNQQTAKEARMQALAELTRAFNKKKIEREKLEKLAGKGSPTNPYSQAKRGPSETWNNQQITNSQPFYSGPEPNKGS